MQARVRARDIAFVNRMRRMRALGLGIGAVPIAAVLHENGAHPIVWLLLALNAFAWPQLAWWIARRAPSPRDAEFRNLLIDSALGGAWVAVMQFNLLPSALIVAMLSIDKIAVAGWRFLARTAAAQVATCLLVWALLGFSVRLESSMAVLLASIPFLFAYPMALSTALHRLTQRIARQNRLLERLNRIDLLTGLPNRRHWDEAATAELARHVRTRRPAAVLLIDLDNFKAVNDRFGHASGDDVLRSVAAVLRATLREIDTPARHGGDEFTVLLAEADARGARDVAERIREGFLVARSEQAASVHCTLSIGIAEADRTLITVDDWLRRADTAMYRAKSLSGNRVDGR